MSDFFDGIPTLVLVAGGCGVIVLLLVCAVLWICCRRKRVKRRRTGDRDKDASLSKRTPGSKRPSKRLSTRLTNAPLPDAPVAPEVASEAPDAAPDNYAQLPDFGDGAPALPELAGPSAPAAAAPAPPRPSQGPV
mmetsp:Transcript_7967/g.25467  ORF Transcript_7967/g.25467 Transcript_7967/m.25467 type:complete len:135 (-) Transcript_7967:97-501(-)